jgi:C-terminal processing protease CtpA/Prc
MRKSILNKSAFLGIAFAAMGTAAFAQQTETPKQETKVTIIKKTIDENGVETVEKIERSSFENIQELEDVNIIINKMEEKPVLGINIEKNAAGVEIVGISFPAKEAGLKIGDIVKEVDGVKIESIEGLQKNIRSKKVGQIVSVNILRNGQPVTVNATVVSGEKELAVEHRHELRRKETKEIDHCQKLEQLKGEPFIGVFINTGSDVSEITDIVKNSGAAASELRRDDIIKKINNKDVAGYDNLIAVLKEFKPGHTVRISYERDGKMDKTRVRLISQADRNPEYTAKLEKRCEEKTPQTKNDEPSKLSENIGLATLELFPNPATEFVTLNFAGGSNESVTVTLLSIEGKEIIRMKLNGTGEAFSEQLNVSKLPKGLYIVTVKQGETVVSKQFSKI